MLVADLTFEDEPDLVPRARHAVAEGLSGRPADLVDRCALVVTELVTNALLHGALPVRVRVTDVPGGVRVEVHDSSRRLPVVPQDGVEALTGRGLALVAALASSWGVAAREGGGKVVWAEVGPGGHADPTGLATDVDAVLAAWPDEPGEALHVVRLGEVPTALLLEAKSHVDGVVRELQLAGADPSSLAPSQAALVESVTRDFADARAEIKRQALTAAERGEETVELVLRLPLSAAEAGERYRAAMDEADRYAHAARLLTLETPADHRVFRHWYLDALIDQLRAAARGEPPPRTRTLLEALAAHVRGLTSQQEAADRLRLLQKVTGELTGAGSVEDIADTVIRNAADFLGAVSGRVALLDEQAGVLRTVPTGAGDQSHAQAYPEIPLAADLPGSVVARTRQRLLLRNLHEISERFPVLAGLYDTERSLHVAPLVVGDHCLGVFALTFQPGTRFDEAEQVEFVAALADALAQAMERQLALERAAAAAERLRFLADAAVALHASLEYRETLDAVTGLLVPRLADWCVVHLVEDGSLRMVRAQHVDPGKTAWAEQLSQRYAPDPEAPTGAPRVVRTGVSELYERIPAELVRAAAVDEEHLRLVEGLALRSAMTVPLTGRSGTFGAITLCYAESGRAYTADDLPFAEDVARRAALAIEAANAFRQQSGRLASITRVAEAAQRAILAPPPPPRVGPAALAARYVSASAEAQVGGDLFEVLPRQGAVRLLIGDVRGKGLTAVRTATVVLGEFRAAAADMDDLAAVARQIDRRVRPYLDDEDFVTALLVDLAEDGVLTLACCGHPPALVMRDGALQLLGGEASLPLGLGADPVLVREQLRPGERLLLATDGLFEARRPDGGFVDVEEVVRPVLDGPVATALDAVLDRLTELTGQAQLGDDLALLLAAYAPTPTAAPGQRADDVPVVL